MRNIVVLIALLGLTGAGAPQADRWSGAENAQDRSSVASLRWDSISQVRTSRPVFLVQIVTPPARPSTDSTTGHHGRSAGVVSRLDAIWPWLGDVDRRYRDILAQIVGWTGSSAGRGAATAPAAPSTSSMPGTASAAPKAPGMNDRIQEFTTWVAEIGRDYRTAVVPRLSVATDVASVTAPMVAGPQGSMPPPRPIAVTPSKTAPAPVEPAVEPLPVARADPPRSTADSRPAPLAYSQPAPTSPPASGAPIAPAMSPAIEPPIQPTPRPPIEIVRNAAEVAPAKREPVKAEADDAARLEQVRKAAEAALEAKRARAAMRADRSKPKEAERHDTAAADAQRRKEEVRAARDRKKEAAARTREVRAERVAEAKAKKAADRTAARAERAEKRRLATEAAKAAADETLAMRASAAAARDAADNARGALDTAKARRVIAPPSEAANPVPDRVNAAERPPPPIGCGPAAAETVPGWYVVQRGDSLWSIARRHYGSGETWRTIRKANAPLKSKLKVRPCAAVWLPLR